MEGKSSTTIKSLSLLRKKTFAILGCVLLLAVPPVLAQSSGDTKPSVGKVVEQKRVEKSVPGTYHYESQYEMTKDGKGNFYSTYESQKNEWFCCMNWFTTDEKKSSKTEQS